MKKNYPKMLYRPGGTILLENGYFETAVAENEREHKELNAIGWQDSPEYPNRKELSASADHMHEIERRDELIREQDEYIDMLKKQIDQMQRDLDDQQQHIEGLQEQLHPSETKPAQEPDTTDIEYSVDSPVDNKLPELVIDADYTNPEPVEPEIIISTETGGNPEPIFDTPKTTDQKKNKGKGKK